jgi:hypothetical protein
MTNKLQIIGAGLPRTGTFSLKNGLEVLLGGECYHMSVLFEKEQLVSTWLAAARGEKTSWKKTLAPYRAAVDWPVSVFWRELADAFPDAFIVLSERDDAETWWRSADATVWRVMRGAWPEQESGDWLAMARALMDREFGANWDDPAAAMARYDEHNAEVRAAIPPDRLIEWNPRQGWTPLCERLGLPVPAEPFPWLNATEDWHPPGDSTPVLTYTAAV